MSLSHDADAEPVANEEPVNGEAENEQEVQQPPRSANVQNNPPPEPLPDVFDPSRADLFLKAVYNGVKGSVIVVANDPQFEDVALENFDQEALPAASHFP